MNQVQGCGALLLKDMNGVRRSAPNIYSPRAAISMDS